MEIRHRKWRFTISSWGLRWSERRMKWNQLIVENGQLIFGWERNKGIDEKYCGLDVHL